MSGFTLETARGQSPAPMDVLQAFFSDILKDETGSGSSYKTYTDALFLDAGGTRVFGVCGLPCFMPVCAELINMPGFSEWLREQKGSILIADEGDHIRAYEVCTPDAPAVPAEISINAASAVREAEAALAAAPGTFNENGELIADLRQGHGTETEEGADHVHPWIHSAEVPSEQPEGIRCLRPGIL